MYRLFFTIFLLIIFTSCKKSCGDEDGLLTADELSWLPYNGGETRIFKSNSNKFDTLLVSPKETYHTPVSHGSAGSCHPKQQSILCRVGSTLTVMDMGSNHKNGWAP